jgi:hypothetical protein
LTSKIFTFTTRNLTESLQENPTANLLALTLNHFITSIAQSNATTGISTNETTTIKITSSVTQTQSTTKVED